MKHKMITTGGKWKVIVLISFLLPFSFFHLTQAQDTSNVRVKPYGFIRNYYTFDSRQLR